MAALMTEDAAETDALPIHDGPREVVEAASSVGRGARTSSTRSGRRNGNGRREAEGDEPSTTAMPAPKPGANRKPQPYLTPLQLNSRPQHWSDYSAPCPRGRHSYPCLGDASMITVSSQGLECCRPARDLQRRCHVQMGPAATLSQHPARLDDRRTKDDDLSCITGTPLHFMMSYLLTIQVLRVIILMNMLGVLLSLKHAIQQLSVEIHALTGVVLTVICEGNEILRPDLPGHGSKTWSPSGQTLKRLRSRPGPKSWGRCVLQTCLSKWLVVLLLCVTITTAKAMPTATDARVGLPNHLGGLGALTTGNVRQHTGARSEVKAAIVEIPLYQPPRGPSFGKEHSDEQ